MPEPFTGNRRALAYFGTIRGLTANRATTQEIWLGLKAAAMSQAEWLEGLPPGAGVYSPAARERARAMLHGVTISDVNALRGIAGQMLRAKQRLATARPEDVIDAGMIGRPPNAVGPKTT
jgi:hypothetical protein